MSIQPIGQQTIPLFDANGNLCVTSINDLTTIEALIATLQTYVTNGSGSVLPSNKSLYDELVAWLNNAGNSLPATTSLYDSGTWKQAPAATLSQASPTQNTYYNILAATANVNILSIAIKTTVTYTLQVKIIIDGQTWTSSAVSCTGGTTYYVTLTPVNDAGTIAIGIGSTSAPFTTGYSIEGRNVQVQVQNTGGATGTMTGAVLYQTR